MALEALIVRLYSLGELSSGEGAESLGISRREFLDLMESQGRRFSEALVARILEEAGETHV